MFTLHRKHTPWKQHLDRVINQLKDAGIVQKWLRDEFNPAIFLSPPKPAREEPLQVA
jgi:hypothetical protein